MIKNYKIQNGIKSFLSLFLIILTIIFSYLIQANNYLLFHSLSELFSIIIACTVFIITWNCKKYFENQKFIFIGIAYLFIALLDLLHTLAYKGMNIFTDYDYYANQLWIATRYLESISIFIFSVLKFL